jgi:phage protein U
MSDMLMLTDSVDNDYILSQVERTYQRGQVLIGSSSRAVTGKLNIRKRAQKTTHSISWAGLTYSDESGGAIGLASLKTLVATGGEYTLTVNLYGENEETFTVMFDPESFNFEVVQYEGRELWQVSATLLEV